MDNILGSPPLWAVAWAKWPCCPPPPFIRAWHHAFLTSALHEDVTSHRSAISPINDPPYCLGRRLGGLQTQHDHCGEDNNLSHVLLYWRHNPLLVLPSSVVWRFFNSIFFCRGAVEPRITPNLEDQGLHFVWAISIDLSATCGSTWSLRSRQHSHPRQWVVQTSSTW
jgi:hypothetical protein